MALDLFIEKRTKEFEREIKVLKSFVEEAKMALKTVPVQRRKDEVFWTTAMSEGSVANLL